MGVGFHLWTLVMVAAAIAGWWLTIRPGSSYRGASRTISCMIVTLAVLMSILAIKGQGGHSAIGPRTAMAMGY